MNDFGLIVLGIAARATALAVLGLGMVLILKRRGPSAGALASGTTLALLVGVTVLAFSPWPRWWVPTLASVEPTDRGAAEVMATPKTAAPGNPEGEAGPIPRLVPDSSVTANGLADVVREIGREMLHPTRSTSTSGWRWPSWVACGFLAGLTVAMFRLILGLWSIQALRRRSRPITDRGLLSVVDSLRDEMGLVQPIAVREAAEVGTPATVGWRRPAILLPMGWREWDAHERRAVLAHEMAHILRRDYLFGLAAQVSLSLHFYHPLVHALARRLRLQQEMAADAWGARLSGGRRPYLFALANLALRQDPRSAAWPARPFLSHRGTFLRRIEMLRDPNALPSAPLPRRGRAVIVAVLVAAGVIVAGFRGASELSRALAQEPAISNAIDPATAPADVRMVIDVRPSAILARPEWKKLADSLQQGNRMLPLPENAGIKLEEIEQVLVLTFDRKRDDFIRPGENAGSPPQMVVILRATRPYDWKPFMMRDLKEVQQEGISYYKSNSPTCFRNLDDRTLLIGMETDAKNPPVGANRPVARHAWDDAWKKAGTGPFRVGVETAWMARQLRPVVEQENASPMVAALVGPLLDQTEGCAVALDIADGFGLNAVATCGTDGAADKVADTLRALLTLGGNMLPNFRKLAENAPPGTPIEPMKLLVATLTEASESARVEREGTTVRFHSKVGKDAVAVASQLLIPAAQVQREAVGRSRSINNLKQLALAMHNYHAAHGSLPPAVLYGPDGKTPYSWRVALLPYLEGQKLYSQYKFDEPWDGPNNHKLIDQRPALFADPGDPSKTNTSYFVLTGPATLFPNRKEGVRFEDVTDGTFSTIMFVEAKRDIPWTKPEDIPYDAAKPLPEFGGWYPSGFNVAFADGSVRFLKDSLDKNLLRFLITRNGGEVVGLPNR